MTNRSQSAEQSTVSVFIDGCAANRFALINVDPSRALEGSAFRLHLTSALEAEYRAALDHLFVPSYVKALLRRLIASACPISSTRALELPAATDRQLAVLAETDLVVTADAKLFRRWCEASPGLVAWPTIETHMKSGGKLDDLLHEHVARQTAWRPKASSDVDARNPR